MVPIKLLTSTQTSSPTLNNVTGTLTTLLQACLVDGFNPKTISTLTVTANVATVVTSTDHGYFVDDTILIAGANESVFNSDFTITEVVNTTTFKFAVTTTEVGATGTITCKIAPLGWDVPFTGTNQRVFRAVEGNRHYLQVVDGTSAGEATMYEAMTGITTGTFKKIRGFWHKSSNATLRSWFILGTKKFFYFGSSYTDTSNTSTCFVLYYFGDIKALSFIDKWATCLGCSDGNGYYYTGTYQSQNDYGLYLVRNFSFFPSDNNLYKQAHFLGPSIFGRSAYPLNVVDKKFHLTKVFCMETNYLRGTIPGFFVPIENTSSINFTNFAKMTLNNKIFMPINILNTTNNSSALIFISLSLTDWE